MSEIVDVTHPDGRDLTECSMTELVDLLYGVCAGWMDEESLADLDEWCAEVRAAEDRREADREKLRAPVVLNVVTEGSPDQEDSPVVTNGSPGVVTSGSPERIGSRRVHHVITKCTQGDDNPMSNEVSYRVRVDEDLKSAFLRVAEATDRTGAQLVRDFMRRYIKNNRDALQTSFLEEIVEE